MTNKWHQLTALQLGDKIAQGEIDPVELTDYFLERIREKDPDHVIYVRLTEDRARAEAEAARARAKLGQRRSPLDGVPISWKDLFDTAGVVTEAGTQLLEGRIPDSDAEPLRRATQAGLVCLGKTNMPDLAFSGLGNNPWTGTGPNPFDTENDRVPGGSSSGAALSVYHGLAPAGDRVGYGWISTHSRRLVRNYGPKNNSRPYFIGRSCSAFSLSGYGRAPDSGYQ